MKNSSEKWERKEIEGHKIRAVKRAEAQARAQLYFCRCRCWLCRCRCCLRPLVMSVWRRLSYLLLWVDSMALYSVIVLSVEVPELQYIT